MVEGQETVVENGTVLIDEGEPPMMYLDGRYRRILGLSTLEPTGENWVVARIRGKERVLRSEAEVPLGGEVLMRLGHDGILMAFELEGTAMKYTFMQYTMQEFDLLLREMEKRGSRLRLGAWEE